MDAIAQTPTTGAERAVLLAAIRWVNSESREVWPSIPRWANMAGVTERTLQRCLRKLEEKGVIEMLEESGGFDQGYPTTCKYKLLPDFEKEAVGPAASEGGESNDEVITDQSQSTPPGVVTPSPRPNVTRGCLGITTPPTQCHRPPGVVSPNPTIPSTIELNKEPSSEPTTAEPRRKVAGLWPDQIRKASNLRRALELALIKGPNLDRLANSTLTPSDVADEVISIQQDPSIENGAAVLATRLAKRAGIDLVGKRHISGDIERVVQAVQQRRDKCGIGMTQAVA